MKDNDIAICRQLAEQFIASRGGGNISAQLWGAVRIPS